MAMYGSEKYPVWMYGKVAVKNRLFIIFRIFLDYVHKVITRIQYDKTRIS